MLINKKSIISFGLLSCLLVPKYNLISIPGYSQGIRLEDCFLFLGFIYILLQRKIILHVIPGKNLYFVFYGIIMVYGILSIFGNGFLPIILWLRWIEYSIFFMLLFYSSLNSFHIKNFIITYIFINSIVAMMQYYGLIGGIFTHGYQEAGGVISSRVAGITGGSWELSAVLVLFTASLIYDRQLKYYIKIIMVIISTSLIYLTGVRTGMVAFVIVTLFALFQVYKINLTRIILILLMIIGFLFNTRGEYLVKIGDTELPASLAVRVSSWFNNIILMSDFDYIWGKGLGFSGLYLDGMYVNIFVDMGIIGILLFLSYYYIFLSSYKVIALAAVIFSLTIDFFTASKIMFAFYLSVYYMKLIRDENIVHSYKSWKPGNFSTKLNT